MNINYNYFSDDDDLIIIAIPQDKTYFINSRKFKSVNSLLQFLNG